jgi:hypothetical protein
MRSTSCVSLGDRDLDAFTKRDLFQVVKGRFKTAERLGRALSILEEHGHIRARFEPARPGPGRKPSPTFDVNPLWRADRTRTSDRNSSSRPQSVGGGAGEPTLAQNAHDSQNALFEGRDPDCEDSEDREGPTTQQEMVEWMVAL